MFEKLLAHRDHIPPHRIWAFLSAEVELPLLNMSTSFQSSPQPFVRQNQRSLGAGDAATLNPIYRMAWIPSDTNRKIPIAILPWFFFRR